MHGSMAEKSLDRGRKVSMPSDVDAHLLLECPLNAYPGCITEANANPGCLTWVNAYQGCITWVNAYQGNYFGHSPTCLYCSCTAYCTGGGLHSRCCDVQHLAREGGGPHTAAGTDGSTGLAAAATQPGEGGSGVTGGNVFYVYPSIGKASPPELGVERLMLMYCIIHLMGVNNTYVRVHCDHST
jgi:hypothetical protein